ncbi:MAG: penicillin-binding protein [Acidobacteriia bacterium]|nr:penicillin-binding protein [Terriglobia bacterium]
MNLKLARYFFGGLVALCLLFEPLLMSFSAIRTTQSNPTATKQKSRTHHKTTKKALPSTAKAPKKTVARVRRGRIRVVDPTIGDTVEGEDLAVRRASVDALGHIDGSVVVADPSNGRILSIVNQKVALTTAYQPCSTFKLLVSLAGLSEGVFSKDSEFKCPTHHRGYLNLTDALAYSCNEYFQNVGERLGFDRVKRYAQQFGFGELAGLDIQGERPGFFPSEIDDEWVRKLSSHGQFIGVTPLEMAAFVSSLANGGTLYYLQYPRTPEEIASFEPKIKRQLDISNLLPDLKEGMSGSVTYGSGKHAYDPLEPVYGKTGSCSGQGTHLGWFVSYAGDSERQLVIVVLTRGSLRTEGPFAAGVAGKIYRELSQQKYFARREEKSNPTGVANDNLSPNSRINER